MSHDHETQVMGIVNVTPDSFYDSVNPTWVQRSSETGRFASGGRYNAIEQVVQHARTLAEQGADIIDIGGESTRPGADPVSIEDECDRVLPVIEALDIDVPISIDTRKPQVAEEALAAGASIVNDVTGLENDAMKQVVADHDCRVVIMDSVTAPVEPGNVIDADDIVAAVSRRLGQAVADAVDHGVDREQIIVDPGIGFGKGKDGDVELIARLDELDMDRPVLVGASRKSFLGHLTGLDTDERLEPSIAAHVTAVLRGADIIRTHDVQETVRAVAVADAMKR